MTAPPSPTTSGAGADTAIPAFPDPLRTAAPGEVLVAEDAPPSGLLRIDEGELRLEIRGQDVGGLGPGDLYGMVNLFLGDASSAFKLTAISEVRYRVASRERIEALAREAPRAWEELLDRSIQNLVRRLRATDLCIETLAAGRSPLRPPADPSPFWQALQRFVSPRGSPSPEDLLRSQSWLSELSERVLSSISRAFTHTPMAVDFVLMRQGDPGDCAWLLARGQVRVLREVEGSGARELAVVGPGAFLGAPSLAVPGARSATCVAITRGWAYHISRPAFLALEPQARVALKRGIAVAVASEVRSASVHLAHLLSGGRDPRP